jgi:hypothetical protein
MGRSNAAVARPSDETALLERCQKDGVFHIEEVQGVSTMETFQKRLVRVIWENSFTAIRSCHDMGKTWTLSKVVLAFTSSFPSARS